MTHSKPAAAEEAAAEPMGPSGAGAPTSTRARTRPRHAGPSLLAPSRSLPAAITLFVLVALGIAGCAAVAGSHTVSSRPRVGGPSVPHLVDRAVDAPPAAFRAVHLAAGVTGTWFTTGGGAVGATRRSRPGVVAAAAVDRAATSALAASGIPGTALAAYRLAAAREATERPRCGIVWPLLAGIGRVESDHGRFAHAVLHTDGYSTPRIIGIPLNGHGTALIRDTDRGRLDGDTVYDRAVGPMQFIPSTWAGWGVDANHDGKADPNNLFDAAAAAADYLCAAGRDLRTYGGQVQAVRSYNNSDAYIVMVLGLEQQYARGVVGVTIPVLPTNPDPGTVRPPNPPLLPPVDPGPPRGVLARPEPAAKAKPKPVHAPTTSTAGGPSTPRTSTSSAPPAGSGSSSVPSAETPTPAGGTGSGATPSASPTGITPCPTDVSSAAPSTGAPSSDAASTAVPSGPATASGSSCPAATPAAGTGSGSVTAAESASSTSAAVPASAASSSP